MKKYIVRYAGQENSVRANDHVDAVIRFANRSISRSRYLHVNGFSVNADGSGRYQAYIAGNSIGDPMQVWAV